MFIDSFKKYSEVIVLIVFFTVVVLLVNLVLNRYFTFLKTSPHSIYETIIYGLLSPFNEAHESMFLNFYCFLPAFITIGVYYKRHIQLIKFKYVFVFSIIATWAVYSKELFIDGINNGAGTSIIGVSLLSISIIGVADLVILAYKNRMEIKKLLDKLSLCKLTLYVTFMFFMAYSLIYWAFYFDNNLASVYLHLTGLGFFILISFSYILIRYNYLKHKKMLIVRE